MNNNFVNNDQGDFMMDENNALEPIDNELLQDQMLVSSIYLIVSR